ncbi:ABC transporter permease [Bifidobacterium callitrichidarum]|uniref:ABC transporter permease n=1 Tax=Bifidobacterium callitrichidarum TaxID=2052941 RepID=A0A2U2NAV4_9BIFI|nr:FtsX-like permease family protein [Bifidobacterium callitrichidarum]PWG66243.1 ABC transporter permease [Bifidobacterium callitrichidarum]
MFSITLKLMKKSARMLIPAGIAILIGTAFIASTFLFSNTMNDSLARQRTAMYGEANYLVTVDSDALDGASQQTQSDVYNTTVDDFHLDRMRATEGVNDVRADVTVGGLIVSHGKHNVTGIAVGTAKDSKLLPVSIADGNQPIDNGEIALPKSVADQLGVRIGDTVTVDSQQAQAMAANGGDTGVKARVVGLTEDPNGAYAYYGGASVLSDNVIAAMSGANDFNDVLTSGLYLDLAGAGQGRNGDAKARTTAEHVKALLPKYYTVMDRATANEESLKALSVNGGTSITTVFLLSFGVLAMFVAALVIANTFQVLVAQRRRTLALLRTIGTKKSQLYASVLFEAGVLGLIASLLGVTLGTGLMAALCASGIMASTGLDARLIVSWQAVAVPVAFGMVMTVIASFGSARSATSVTPLEALRPVELTVTRRGGVMRAVCSAILVAGGIALAGFAIWQMHESIGGHESLVKDHYPAILLAAIAGCAILFLGSVLSAVFWLPLLMRGVGALVALGGPSATIAHANIQKNPRRVAATGAALLIGVTLVATIATGAASAKQTMGEAMDQRYSVDMIASGDMTDKQATMAAETKGVSASVYAPTTMMYATSANGTDLTVLLVGVKDTAELAKVMKADLGGVTIDGDNVLLPKYDSLSGKAITFGKSMIFQANPDGMEIGDGDGNGSGGSDTAGSNAAAGKSITLTPQQADFRRVSSDYHAVAFVNESHFTDGSLETSGHMLLMRVDAKAAGVTLNDVLTNVQQAFSASAGVTVSGPVAERSMAESMINGMMALLVGLIAVAVLIALVGVANTLSLSVIERTRESATLRAIGMTRGQLRRSLAVEALLLSLVSGVVGVLLGTGFGWLGSYMVFSLYGNVAFLFDWVGNGVMLGVAALAALLASVAPARRAVKVPPVEALAEA